MSSDLPAWTASVWTRNYIRRWTREGGPLGEPDTSVTVRYLQTLADGHGWDLRVRKLALSSFPESARSVDDLSAEHLQTLAADGAIEGFAGITKAAPEGDGCTALHWHAAFLFPPQLGEADEPATVLERIRSGEHETLDVGRAVPSLPTGRGKPVVHWLEHAPDGSYAEEWVALRSFSPRGAHVAATRAAREGCGASWLGILGNCFAFARDIDRASLPESVRGRSVQEVLSDDTLTLALKRRVMDCEFSFGTFGQGGGVGGVVEISSLPWRKGEALARVLGEGAATDWSPVREEDGAALRAAIEAVLADHEAACQTLREAEAGGQAGVVELMKARGAI